MIDEFIKDTVAPTVRSGICSLYMCVNDWFRDFRWIEFTAAVSAAFVAGTTMAGSMHLSDAVSRHVGEFGAIVGAICYIRSPKTRWNGDAGTSQDFAKLEAYARGTDSCKN